MKNLYFNLFIIGCLLTSLACSSNKLEISNRNFSEQIDLQQNLIFTFNTDVAADTILNKWVDGASYIDFTPKVPGKFKWTAANELLFSPASNFNPSTDYSAQLTEAILKTAEASGKKLSLGEEKAFSFHTPYLNLLDADIFWVKNANGAIEAKFNLNFNYQVNPMEVANLVKIQVGDKTIPHKVTTTNVDGTVQVSITQPTGTTFDGKTAVITIKEGLKCAESAYVSKKPMELKKEIPGKDEFKITQVLTEYEGETGFIQVYTNQSVETNQISRFIKLEPETKFSVETRDYGFQIKGDFKPGSYTLTLSKQLRGIFGGALPEAYEQTIVFGEMKPYISFTSPKAMYLTNKGNKNIGIKIINVPKVRVKIYKIYENNILAFMRGSGLDGNSYYEEEYYEPYYYLGDDNNNEFGDIVVNREYETKGLPKSGGIYALNVEVPETNNFKGIYAVKVQSTENQWLHDTQLVSVSDIGFIVKETPNDILVFANSILSAQPLSGVSVNLISANNQSVYTAETNAEGVAVFSDIKKKAPNFNIQLITARQGQDFNFLVFNQNKVETSRYEVGGARENQSGYQAFIYGDRDIYRPGEKVYINTIIRDAQWKTVGNLPVKLKILLPNGKEFTTLKGNLNEQSAFATSVQIPESSVTGTYMAEVYTSNDVLLNSKAISIEEFIPDRIKVNVNLDKPALQVGETLEVTATALNLFGPPAANRNYEMTFQLKRKAFLPKAFPDYNFDIKGNKNNTFNQDVRQGKTNEEGVAKEKFTIGEEHENLGMLTASIFTTVFDESGRPVNRSNNLDVHTQEIFYGIQNFDSYVGTAQALRIPLLALDTEQKPLHNIQASVRVIKHEWQTVLQRNEEGSFNYVSQKKELVLEEKTIKVSGTNTAYSFVPTLSGEYEIRVGKPGTDAYVNQYFYAYGYGYTQNSSFEVNKEGQVTIELDKPKYQVGEKAQVLMKAPFAGKMLVTVERNKVLDYFYVDTDKKSASVTIPIKEEYLPNAYITATLIKPLDDGLIPLTVAHGFVPMMIEQEDNVLPVTIEAAAQSGSKTKQTVTVKTKSNAEVTIAVVDEGILQLKNFATPDPYGYFFRKRALEVNAYDLYPRLFPELTISTKSSVGGDGYDLSKRVNPLTNKRINLVAFWSGTLQTNGSGEAQFTVDIPQFSGDLRIMAIAYKGNAFGSSSKNMKVADPMVISTSMPRFLSPNDQLLVPVTLSNTTNQATTATARIKATGAVSVEGEDEQRIEVPANSEAQVQFAVNAKESVGTAQVVVEVSAHGKNFSDETDITVRPITSLQKTSGAGIIAAGNTQPVNFSTEFIPSTVDTKLVVSQSPLAQFSDNLDYLLRYPYGCVEQITSSVFAQLYFDELSKSILQSSSSVNKAASNRSTNATANIQEAIRRLQAMQMYNGALSYWPSGGYESWWGTAYAGHFLTEAKKAGFQVNDQVLDRLYSYLQQQVKQKQFEEYFYYDDGNSGTRKSKKIAPKEVAYSLYVMALGGKGDVSTMNYYKSNRNLLAIDSKYLLAASYQLLGDNASYRAIIPSNFSGERSVDAFGGSFYSYLRDEAISLNALLEAEPKNPQVPMMAKHLSEQLKKEKYVSTQEASFALLALGKFAKQSGQSDVTASIKAGGKELANFSGENLALTKGIANQNVTIQTSGSGNLYYFWQVEGLSNSNQVKEEDSFLQVRKSFYDRFGKPISGNTFRQNDMVVVKITLVSTDRSTVENVVVTDMLPAGFEIENPRISSIPELAWASNATAPDHFDVRDDRINLFTSASANPKSYYYVVRAVSKGTFKMGPVSADAMYNGEYHSINGSGEIQVVDRGDEVK